MSRRAAFAFLAVAALIPGVAFNGEPTLRHLIAGGSLSELRRPRFPDYQDQIAAMYAAVNYTPVWVPGGRPTTQALEAIEALWAADFKGLNSDDYDGPLWSERLQRLRTEEEISRFDLALTVSLMRYVSDLHVGRVNPKLCHFAFDIEPKKFPLAEFFLDRLIRGPDISRTLDSIEPPFPGYKRLQHALRMYMALAREDDAEPLPDTGKPIEPGDPYAGCARLSRLLARLGDLQGSVPVSGRYEGALVEAVKRFQLRHGLDADGRIGKLTLAELNTPLDRRVRQIQLTLERWRWAPHEFTRPPIVVNIPEFRLRAYDDSYSSRLEMNVVTGRAYKTSTPVFSNKMRYVIFRPYWNVPRSIQRGEFVPHILRDRAYLAKNGYEIVDAKGSVVTTATVDDRTLALLRSGALAIRQPPGPKNALGLVKFLFPNEYNVYMHDTPATQLFSRARRDFSHGCIRVQAPEELAMWVLRDRPEWTRERIRAAMNGSESIQANMRDPIPVLVVYGTAVAPESGEVRFLADIYGHDAVLEKLLAKGHPYSE